MGTPPNLRRRFGFDIGATASRLLPMTPDRQIAILVFGGLAAAFFVYFVVITLARRRRIREGRAVDVGDLIVFGSKAGKGKKTVLPGDRRPNGGVPVGRDTDIE
jgi:hypothetical protein